MPRRSIIVVGASAGGVEALMRLVKTLPPDFPAAIFVVLHIPASEPSLLPQILSRAGQLPVVSAQDMMAIEGGHVYVAPPDHHLVIEREYMRVVRGPRENRHRPAIDPLFRSAALTYATSVIGAILTGSLDDGTAGLHAIKERGGIAIVQDPKDALYPSMPQSALAHVTVDYCVPMDAIGPLLVQLVEKHGRVEGDESISSAPAMEREVRIVEMETNPLSEGEQVGAPSVFSCPECGGVLWEVEDGNILRFRCRTGHAFSSESVLAEQTDALERALWVALKIIDERVELSRRLGEQAGARGQQWLVRSFEARRKEAEHHATILRQVLLKNDVMKADSAIAGE